MHARRLASCLALLAISACGRVSFEPRRDAPDDTVDDVSILALGGCSDGEREGLTSETVAACGATWTGTRDLRLASTGQMCGDDLGECASPEDACAAGWHICARSGAVAELRGASGDECVGLSGRYLAAADHCSADMPCGYYSEGTFPCSPTALRCVQPICCGTGCHPLTGCMDAVWLQQTHAASDQGAGCAAMPAATGVLCCR